MRGQGESPFDKRRQSLTLPTAGSAGLVAALWEGGEGRLRSPFDKRRQSLTPQRPKVLPRSYEAGM